MDHQPGELTVFWIYLTGAFVSGFSMCMLNAVVNPLLNTLAGGGKKGNQLIQFGGLSELYFSYNRSGIGWLPDRYYQPGHTYQ